MAAVQGTWYPDGMRATIDKAGRVVIPAAIRERAGLTPGSELEITLDDLGVRLERAAPGPEIVREGPLRSVRPRVRKEALPQIDFARLVEEERNRWPW